MEKQVSNRFGETVGIIKDSRYITWRRQEHYFIKFGGFGISSDILKDLEDAGVTTVVIIYTKTSDDQEVYESDITDWKYNASYYEWKGDEQKILATNKMVMR